MGRWDGAVATQLTRRVHSGSVALLSDTPFFTFKFPSSCVVVSSLVHKMCLTNRDVIVLCTIARVSEFSCGGKWEVMRDRPDTFSGMRTLHSFTQK